jgi:hypothetical protein
MALVFPSIDELNTKYYDGKLMKLSEIDSKVQDYKEDKADLGLKKADLMESIPAIWTHKELIESTHGDDFTKSIAKTPNFLVYMYIYSNPMLFPPYKLGGKLFYNAPMYIGKGTVDRVCSHGQPKGGDVTLPTTRLRQYNLDFRASGLEPYVLILAKSLDETRAKWLEADVIEYFRTVSHYTRGEAAFQMAPPLLNARSEANNAGHLIKVDGTFGEIKP